MGFLQGLVEGFAESGKEGLDKLIDDMNARITGASQYHVARATRQQEKFDDQMKETESGLKLIQGFFGDEPNAWEKSMRVFKQYGSTLEGAQRAAEEGSLALSVAQKQYPDEKLNFGSFFDFGPQIFDPENPLTLEGVLAQVGSFTYTPGDMVNVDPKNGFTKFLYGDDPGKAITKRINEDLATIGIDTSKSQPVENVMPSSFSVRGTELMNVVKTAAHNKAIAEIEGMEASTVVSGVRAEVLRAQKDKLQIEIDKLPQQLQANINAVLQDTQNSVAATNKTLLETELLDGLGRKQAEATLKATQLEAELKWVPKDWNEFDAGLADKLLKLQTKVNMHEMNGNITEANRLKGVIYAVENARIQQAHLLGDRDKADTIFSKTSPTTLWSNMFQSSLEDFGLSENIEVGLDQRIRLIGKGNKFAFAAAKFQAAQNFRDSYAEFPEAQKWMETQFKSIEDARETEVENVLSHVYRDDTQEGGWFEGGKDTGTETVGKVIPYYDPNYKTDDKTVPARNLKLGQIYKLTYEDIVKMKGEEKAKAMFFDYFHTQHAAFESSNNSMEGVLSGHIYGVWGGGPKYKQNWIFNRAQRVVN